MSENENAEVFLQWKGTDACFDFHCACGNSVHIDAQFAYYVKCERCGQHYEMPYSLEAKPVAESEAHNPLTAYDEETDWELANQSTQRAGERFCAIEKKRSEEMWARVRNQGIPFMGVSLFPKEWSDE